MTVQPRREGVIGSMQLTVTGKQIDIGDACAGMSRRA